jgi:hypothetical protein
MQAAIQYQQKQESLSVLLLLIVVLTLLRPITPLITDSIAHNFYAQQHEQLHRIGINHLEKDIQAANEAQSSAEKKGIGFEQILVFFLQFILSPAIAIFSIILFKEPKCWQLRTSKKPTLQPPDANFVVCPDNTTPVVKVV